MRKIALVLALAVAAAPTAALAAKKKSAKAPAAKAAKAAPANPNANGQKFVVAAFSQPYLAWKSVWAPEAAPAKGKKK